MPVDAYSFLLDAPADARERIQIAKLGRDFKDARYGTFSITAQEVNAWAANLARLPGGRALIDTDHLADKPGAARNTRAAGWITGVALDDGVPMADVEWTPKGREAIENKEYLFISPTYGPWTDETGETHQDVLQGAALTNKPFLNMPTVCLSRADVFASEEQLAPVPTENAPGADSRRHMPEITAKILEKLGLDDEADEAAVEAKLLDAIAEPKTLEQLASDAGKVVLDQAKHDELTAKATEHGALTVRLDKLEGERADEKFEVAFTTAQGKGRVDAKPETKTAWRELYDASADAALKTLASLPDNGAVNVTANGAGGDAPEGEAPAGVDPDAYELDRKVEAHMAAEKAAGRDADYRKSLEAVRQEA